MSKEKSVIENLSEYKFDMVDEDVLSTERFAYPDMGDFYLNAVNDPYYQRLQAALDALDPYQLDNMESAYNPVIRDGEATENTGLNTDEKEVANTLLNGNSPEAIAFFMDGGPPVKELGDHPDIGVVLFKATTDTSERSAKMGVIDGDTLVFYVDTIDAGSEEVKNYITQPYERYLQEIEGIPMAESKKYRTRQLRTLGINAPEVPHYSSIFLPVNIYERDRDSIIIEVPYKEVKETSDSTHLIIRRSDRADSDGVKLLKRKSKYYEILDVTQHTTPERVQFVEIAYLSKMEETDPVRIDVGLALTRKMQALIQACDNEVYYMIDKTALNYTGFKKYPNEFIGSEADALDELKFTVEGAEFFLSQLISYNRYRYSGFSQFGMDQYGRWLGSAYVKFQGQWINLAKYMITQSNETEVFPDYSSQPLFENNGGTSGEAFNLGTYDYDGKVFYDIHGELSKLMDDRRRVQQKIFGLDFDAMKKWNVTIGDTTLFVPPTSIRSSTATTYERIPVLRGKGSMTRGGQKVEKIIELTVFFNEEQGINGIPFEDTLPNGNKITYYMNGLRSLIAQFKFTPFLPIENTYINTILNIDAVTLRNIQVMSTPNYPRLYKAIITLERFDFYQFMPELPMDTSRGNEYYNPFSTVFNFGLMRWYYQRPIILGQKLKDLSINSLDYLEKIEGSKTALMPMNFKSSGFKIYVASEEHLKKMMQIKILRTKDGNRTTPLITETERNYIQDMLVGYDKYASLDTNPDIQQALIDLEVKLQGKEALMKLDDDLMRPWGGSVEPYFVEAIRSDNPYEYRRGNTIIDVRQQIDKIVELTNIQMMAASTEDVNFYMDRAYFKEDPTGFKLCVSIGVRSANNGESIIDNIVRDAETVLSGKGVIEQSLEEDFKKGNIVVEYNIPIVKNNVDGERIKMSNGSNDNIVVTAKTLEISGGGDSEGENTGAEMNVDRYEFARYSAGAHYMSHLRSLIELYEEEGYASATEEVEALSQDADFLETLTYDELDIGPIDIVNIAAQFGNTFTQVGLNGTEGYASQFMGGQDSVVELSFQTTSEYATGIINSLPSVASHLVSTYKLVLPAAPIVFESDITRLMGIREVAVENVQVETVPNQPGLYQVHMRIISVDRTLRKREGIDKINEFAHGGLTSIEGQMDIKNRTFADLNVRLGQAELYPDLELPTLKELEESGYKFLRHTFDGTRVFPDPDFYFNYGHTLQSEIFRESVLQTNAETYEKVWKDSSDGSFKTSAEKHTGFKEYDENEKIKQRDLEIKEAENISNSSSSTIQQYISDELPALDMMSNMNTEEVWNIGENIRVALMEKPYSKALELYERETLDDSIKKKTKWLYEEYKPVEEIKGLIDDILNKPLSADKQRTGKPSKSNIRSAAFEVLKRDEWKEIFMRLGINDTFGDGVWLVDGEYDDFSEMFGELCYAAACAMTGKREYRKGEEEVNYGPDPTFIGFKPGIGQDASERISLKDFAHVAEAIEFGPFKTRMYNVADYRSITRRTMKDNGGREKNPRDINTQYFLLDPYYANASIEEIVEYKLACVKSIEYAVEAFLRNCLVWLRNYVEDKIMPNFVMDIYSKEFEEELENYSDKDLKGGDVTKEEEKLLKTQIREYIDFLKNSKDPIDNGKAFLIIVTAIGGKDIYNMIRTRNFSDLNQLKNTLTSTMSAYNYGNSEFVYLRKLFFAMDAAGIIDGVESLSTRYDNAVQDYRSVQLERKYIEFAEDPNVYVRHSFYDMCVHDMRGRMARAFPSFYMVLIDEGAEIGMYKLNDNFYNINSVSEIQVHRSRKIPADTCRIVISNLFHSYTTNDEDRNVSYNFNPMDIFNSVFRPSKIYEREQEKRLRQQPLNKVKLQPGTRIHIRMGYGANAATLPVAFNGKITEINAGDIMELVAQGDGMELMNPFAEEIDAEEVQNEDKFVPGKNNMWINADTPKNIIDGILNSKGSFWAELWKIASDNYFKNPHKYGITNFGDTRINSMFKDGEIVQNIFEGIGKPMWGDLEDGKTDNWNMEEVPKISTELLGKTAWDILHFCASATPDFIVGLAPFGMRSTIFHGHPRYYYAFEYILDDKGNIRYEKRKPYSQYHLVTSFSDIIKNNIKADNTRVRTNAVGSYKTEGMFGSHNLKTTDRIYVDWDIYPENQRSMVYDTQLLDKGIPMTPSFISSFVQWVESGREAVFEHKEDPTETSGSLQRTKMIARRMTANALKDSIRDMYAGEIILMGIPSLKPHDRLIINDTYENMSGDVLVESHTLSMSSETGLTSTVVPDCISVVDDQFEVGSRLVKDNITTAGLLMYGAVVAGSHMLGKGLNPIKGTVAAGATAIKSIGFVDKGITYVSESSIGQNKIIQKLLAMTKAKEQSTKKVAKEVGEGAFSRLTAKVLSRVPAGAVAGVPGVISTVLWSAVEMGTLYVWGGLRNADRKLKLLNGQVLTIFPVKHNGKVMTSGLTGEIGSVYGSSRYGHKGMLENVASYLTKEDDTVWQKALDFLLTDDFQEFAEAYSKGSTGGSVYEDYRDEDVANEFATTNFTQSIAKAESRKIAGYRELLLTPRINVENTEDLSDLGARYTREALTDSRMIESNARISSENEYIFNDNVLMGYVENDVLKTIWTGTDKDHPTEEVRLSIGGGVTKEIMAHVKTEGDNKIYDLPFLKEDALILLKEIVSIANSMIPVFDAEKESSKTIIGLTSALIVGEKEASLAGMGYSFTLKASGDQAGVLRKALNRLWEYNERQFEEGNTKNRRVFAFEAVPSVKNKYMISVLPRKRGY